MAIGGGVQWIDLDGTILRADDRAAQLLGHAAEQCVGRALREFFIDEEVLDHLLASLKAGRVVPPTEARIRNRNGGIRLALISASVAGARSRRGAAKLVTRDITVRRQDELALQQFKDMVDAALDAIVAVSVDGTITYWNRAAERLYGYRPDEVLGRLISLTVPENRSDEFAVLLAKIKESQRVDEVETQRVRKDGTEFDVSISLTPILDNGRRPIGATAVMRDITERKRIEQELRRGAFHDSLTGLPNRAYFNERVAQALQVRRRDPAAEFAVLFLDVDGFKLVNDSLGHSAGDQLLVIIAARLRECVRPGDVVARLGGDEFTILLEHVNSEEDISRTTSRIARILAHPTVIGPRTLNVTASIGVARGDPSYERPEDIVRDADIAMYHAKESRMSRAKVFGVEMREAAHERLGLQTDLRRALEREEFRLVYQPIVDLDTGHLHSFEALLRWDHPTRGEVLPDQFVPAAEQSGLIVPIGAWALRQACMRAREWVRHGKSDAAVPVSVNLSSTQIGREAIVEEVSAALRESSIDPRTLQLELTESVLLEDSDLSTKRLEALRGLAVELHVDDFGTGYSSLSYLPQFPVQAIKIDRSFIGRMGARRTDLAIIRSIIELASALELGVIAEGVETTEQRENLLRFGCGLGQGYLFSMPLSAQAATELALQ
jgi:diguanylate cyclase (GGDEF)-like protein/PAS domain S-box-containing protein